MPFRNIPLDRSNFDSISFESVLLDAKERTCNYYFELFNGRAKKAEEATDEKTHEAFSVLSAITSMVLKPESKSDPFIPIFTSQDGRSAIVDDFSDEHINVLEEIIFEIKDPELRARISDVVWLRKRNHKAAVLAIASYLESAKILEDPNHWTQGMKRIERALRVAASLRSPEEFERVTSHIEETLKKYNGEDPLFFSARLMALLIEYKHGDPSIYSPIAKKLAERADGNNDFEKARTYREIESKWHQLANDEASKLEALRQAAECFFKNAKLAISGESPSYMVASVHMLKAVEAHRRIPGQKERADELHNILLEYQSRIGDEMKKSSVEIDVTDEVKQALDKVKGLSIGDAILIYVQMLRSPEVGHLREETEQSIKDYPLQHLMHAVVVNKHGMVGANMPSVLSSNSEEAEEAIRAYMHKQSSFYHATYAQTIIEPIRKQLIKDHRITLTDIMSLVTSNPFVPVGHEYIYAQGLLYGFEGSFLEATHLLVPQIENSIRHVLKQRQVNTTSLDSKGAQKEKSLNELLELTEIRAILGKDLTFDLQGLLVEQYGANLRNLMAHGLMAYDEYYAYTTVYFWWLTLRMCCIPIIIALQSSTPEATEVESEEPASIDSSSKEESSEEESDEDSE